MLLRRNSGCGGGGIVAINVFYAAEKLPFSAEYRLLTFLPLDAITTPPAPTAFPPGFDTTDAP